MPASPARRCAAANLPRDTVIITDPIFYAFAIPAVLFLGLAKGGFAGVGMLATPLVALYIPPLEAAALILPILISQDIITVWVYRRDWDAWNLKAMIPGSLLGIAAAALLAAHVSHDYVRLAVGLISLAFVLNAWFGRLPKEARATAAGGVFWGAVSGFTSTLSQAGGPPFQIHVMPQRLAKLTFVGTTAIFFAAVNAFKIVPYTALGQFSIKNLATSLALLPLAYLTNMIGIWLVRRTPTELFYRIVYWLVFFVALALIWQGASAILRGG